MTRFGAAVFAVFVFVGAFATVLFGEKVRYVIDGDTFILENNQRVRMIGIDAPEVGHRKYGKRAEPFGREARHYLKQLIEKKEVVLKPGEEPFDRFGRRLAYVYLEDGTFVNQKMVEDGYAETFRALSFSFKKGFQELERTARTEKRGMWSERTSTWHDSLYEFFADLARGH